MNLFTVAPLLLVCFTMAEVLGIPGKPLFTMYVREGQHFGIEI